MAAAFTLMGRFFSLSETTFIISLCIPIYGIIPSTVVMNPFHGISFLISTAIRLQPYPFFNLYRKTVSVLYHSINFFSAINN